MMMINVVTAFCCQSIESPPVLFSDTRPKKEEEKKQNILKKKRTLSERMNLQLVQPAYAFACIPYTLLVS